MFKNFLKTALRAFWKHKVFSFINVFGLALGLSASFLIYLYVSYELSYDTYHTKTDHIFRLLKIDNRPSEDPFTDATPSMGPAMANEYPDIRAMARISAFRPYLVINENARFQEHKVVYADSSLFSIFSFLLLEGNPHDALKAPYSVVLSQTASKKYFGEKNPIGRSLLFDGSGWAENTFSAIVTGVIQDIPANSSFRSDIILSMSTFRIFEPSMDSSWNQSIPTYLLMADKANPEKLEAQLPSFLRRHIKDRMDGDITHLALSLEPLKNIYLHSKFQNQGGGNIYNIYVFSAISFLIVLIACINFINLTTARAAERAKEVSIRKVIGSSRIQLIWQFLGESILLALIAYLLACLFCALFLPAFNELSGKTISQGIITSRSILLLLALALFIGILAGIYPAFLLSSFKPAALKGSLASGKNGVLLRQILVVFQFTVSIVLTISTISIFRQLNYLRSQPLGFKKQQMLVIDFQRDTSVKRHIKAIKENLSICPNVLSVSASSGIPISGFEPANYNIENKSGIMQPTSEALYMIDDDFFNQYQINILAGRAFSKQFPTDPKDGLIINEACLKSLGYSSPNEIIGKRFSGEGDDGTVIGVVRNFNFQSLREGVTPLIFRTFFLANRYITLEISAKNTPSTIRGIGTKWKEIAPQCPFEYFFLDEAIDNQYRSDANFGQLFFYFGVFAIFISCMGLLGLTLFSVYKKTREIGIRKAMGASILSIVNLLSKDFLKLIIISFFIGSPIAWLVMNKWLRGFAYRAEISWWVFLLSGLTVMSLALITISFQTIRAAKVNPIKSLRSE